MNKISSAAALSYFCLILLIAYIPACLCSPWLHVGTNGYRGLTVSIHPSVPEQIQLVEKLKELLLSTSSALYRITSGKLFFDEVIITLPVTWTKEFHNMPSIGDIFSRADIRVYGNGGPSLPYCVQHSDCAQQGKYIQFTTQFLQSVDDSAGQLLMQEFSKCRYGIFENLNSSRNNFGVFLVATSQGFRCDGLNQWDIFSNNPDVLNSRVTLEDSNGLYSEHEPSPVFKLYATRSEERYMLLFDTSRTLWENSSIATTIANLTLKRLVRDFLPDKSLAGFITFSNKVNIMRGLTRLTPSIKENFFQGLTMEFTENKQALASAIAKAVEVLSNSHGSKIIILSDGNNDIAPPLENIIPSLQGSMITVSVFSPKIRHKNNLHLLAAATGGNLYFLSSDWMSSIATQTSMLDHFSKSAGSADIQVYLGQVVIMSHNVMYRVNISIDKFLGKNTQFEFIGENLGESGINIFIVSFSGVIYNLKNATLHQSAITFHVNDETGKWTVLFVNPAQHFSHINIRVTSRPLRQDLKVTELDSWVDVQQDIYYSTIRIFADLHEGPFALTDANVTANVKPPLGEEIVLALRDTGSGADITAGDGVYSAYFTRFNGDGIYTVLTHAESTNSTRTQSRERSNFEHGKRDFVTDYMTRYKYAGTFIIHDYQSGLNKIPPGQVTDLVVDEDEDEPSAVKIVWTAPGSDFDAGTVALYDLRMGTAIQDDVDLNIFFKTWHSITSSTIIKGTLDPSPSGTRQMISVSLLQLGEINGGKVYFALQSQDINGNPSKISNVAVYEVKFNSIQQDYTLRTLDLSDNSVTAASETVLATTLSTSSHYNSEFLTVETTDIELNQSIKELQIETSTQRMDKEASVISELKTRSIMSTTPLTLPLKEISDSTEYSISKLVSSLFSTEFHIYESQNGNNNKTVNSYEVISETTNTTELSSKLLVEAASDTDTVSTYTSKKTSVIEMETSNDRFPSETDNKTEGIPLNISAHEINATHSSVRKNNFAEAKVKTSTIVAAWVGGFCLMFFIITGVAMVMRSWRNRSKYDVSKMEKSGTNSAREELLHDDSTMTVENAL